jgi:hypothetical protein
LTPNPGAPSATQSPIAHLHPRAVSWRHALTWYEEALRLFKRAPLRLCALAFVTLAVEFGLDLVPDAGALLGKIVSPLVACGLVYGVRAADRGQPPRLVDAVAAFTAPAGAVAAILGASAVTFAGEALAAWWLSGVNLLASGETAARIAPAEAAGIYATGLLVSLPVAFVPFHVLFEGAGFAAAFRASWQAFVVSTGALVVYAVASLVLVVVLGVLTAGIGLVAVLPLATAAGYAAWIDVFGVERPV